MLIRDFQLADTAPVNRVALAAFAQYQTSYSDWEAVARGVGQMASLADQAQLIVAEVNGALAGAVAYCPPESRPRADFFEPGSAIIRMLVVDPVARGQGVGRQLTQECIARARKDAATLISLHTSPVMHVALAMYLRLGFRLRAEVPDRFGVPYAVYVLDL
jgi:ribosomal protein S18 acetylase RimI-like enzyme